MIEFSVFYLKTSKFSCNNNYSALFVVYGNNGKGKTRLCHDTNHQEIRSSGSELILIYDIVSSNYHPAHYFKANYSFYTGILIFLT